jgi:uncharacterized protein
MRPSEESQNGIRTLSGTARSVYNPHMELRKADKSFVFFLLAFYATWILRVFLLPIDYSLSQEWARQCWSQSLRVLIWIVPVFIYLARVEKQNPLAYLKLNVLPRGRQLLYGTLLTVVFLTLTVLSSVFFQGGNLFNFTRVTASGLSLSFFSMSFVAVAEEVFFRGFVFQHIRQRGSFAAANAVTVVLFWMIHWPGWLYMKGLDPGLLSLSVGVLFIAWVLGWLMELTKSLWPPILLHLLNNVISGILSR